MVSRRARAWIRRGVATVAVILVVGMGAGTFYASTVIDRDLLQLESGIPAYDVEVKAVASSFVTLSRTEASTAPGLYGLEWEDGYVRVGRILGETDDTVTRDLPDGPGALDEGVAVGVDRFAYETDPEDAGLGFDEVIVDGQLGRHPAWLLDGTDDTWAIVVHDREAGLRESLRVLPVFVDAGITTLVITLRNDPGAPETDDQRHALGDGEWEDVEAALLYALENGAQDAVLMGYGTGASVVATFMYESAWAERVQGLIFDSPVLDPGAVVDEWAAGTGVPGFLSGWAKALATLRWGVDWTALDHVARVDELDVRTLLFHGDADEIAPKRSSDAFADAAPRLVTYVEVEEARHTQVWNADPERYERAVTAFLTGIVVGLTDLDPVVLEP